MKRPGRHEQYVVRANHPILRVHQGPLDDREHVTLDTFAGDFRSVPALAASNLVQLVDEKDAGFLDADDGLSRQLIRIDQLVLFLTLQQLSGFAHTQLALARLALKDPGAAYP